MNRWIDWKPSRSTLPPVPPETLVYIKLKGDRGNEGLHLKPQPAGRYKWTRQSGIIAYATEGNWP